MNKYVSILRGINVGGQKAVKMEDLRALYKLQGFENVISYIQSGNVIFGSPSKTVSKLQTTIQNAILEKYSLEVHIEIRSASEIARVVADFPFGEPDLAKDGARFLVTFLSRAPTKDMVGNLRRYVRVPEQLVIRGREAFLHCPGGYGKSKLSNSFLEKKLGVQATTRNLKTVTKLRELLC